MVVFHLKQPVPDEHMALIATMTALHATTVEYVKKELEFVFAHQVFKEISVKLVS